jgi:hypothetical protein
LQPQDATILDLLISTDALHDSGGSSAHHQEHNTVHTASGIVKTILLLAATVDEVEAVYTHTHTHTHTQIYIYRVKEKYKKWDLQ